MTQLNYDPGKLRIRVCCGMHCASAGGGRSLETALYDALAAAGISDQVDVYRAHCLGECADGPCVRVGASRFYHIQPEDVPALVREEILPRLNR